MKKSTLALIALLFAFQTSWAENFVIKIQPETHSQDSQKEQKDQVDLSKYIDFILEWTSYQYSGEPLPKTEVIDHELLQIFAHGDFKYAQAEAKGKDLPIINAYYDPKRKTLYISNQIDLEDPVSEITLVHEMVHYLQDVSGYTESLDGHLECSESEAYDVQILWQIFEKVDEQSIPDVRQLSLQSAMKCMGNQSLAFPKYSPQE